MSNEAASPFDLAVERGALVMRALPADARAASQFAVERVAAARIRERLAQAQSIGVVATPFQSATWLAALDSVLAPALGASIEFIWVTDGASRDLIVALPIAVRRIGGLRVAEIADLGVADYQAPLIGPAAASLVSDRAACAALLAAIKHALGDVDLLRFEKMPHEISGRANLLTMLAGVRPSRFSANRLTIETTVEAFIASRGKKYRKEAERCFRRIADEGEVRFARAETAAEIGSAYTQLEAWQHDRHIEAGHVYALDRPELSYFYRHLALAGARDGAALTSPSLLGGECRGEGAFASAVVVGSRPPQPAFGHLLPRGEKEGTLEPAALTSPSPLGGEGRGEGDFASADSSFASIFTLSVGGRFVAILYGVEHDGTFTLLRIADAGDAWKHVSPGRLVVIETMRHMVGRGVRVFDMGIGDYPFKRWIGCTTHPLADLEIALGWRALPKVAAGRLKRRLRENDRLRALVARLRAVRAPAPAETDDPK